MVPSAGQKDLLWVQMAKSEAGRETSECKSPVCEDRQKSWMICILYWDMEDRTCPKLKKET